MFDSTLDISEYGLQQHILLLHYLLLVEQLLHGLMIPLLSVECQVLQLLLILPVVQDSLRENYILIYFCVQVCQCWPLIRVNLHDIEHHLVLHLLLSIV